MKPSAGLRQEQSSYGFWFRARDNTPEKILVQNYGQHILLSTPPPLCRVLGQGQQAPVLVQDQEQHKTNQTKSPVGLAPGIAPQALLHMFWFRTGDSARGGSSGPGQRLL